MTAKKTCPKCGKLNMRIDYKGIAWICLLAIPEAVLFYFFGGVFNIVGVVIGICAAAYYFTRPSLYYCSHCLHEYGDEI
jgi:hypothetical protein